MGFFKSIFIWLFLILIFIINLGEYSEQKDKEKLQSYIKLQRRSGPIPDLGVKPPKKPTRIIRFNSKDKECLSKQEFYEGMENAEMRGDADDPSAQDIYDEFNR
ncbi:MAG: hypothetical protein L3J66_11045 [Bacteroidales bacterium]|nr:hypothetical protein [Bacteroidales bacterium]